MSVVQRTLTWVSGLVRNSVPAAPDSSRTTRRITRKFQIESLEDRALLAFDPSPLEQAFFESVNRMRMNPQGELNVIFSSLNPLQARDSKTQGAIDFFHVDTTELQNQ